MQALYKLGTQMVWEGVSYDYLAVPEDQVQAHLDAGWFLTAREAAEAGKEPKEATFNRAQLEDDAKQLGIRVDRRWDDARLQNEISKKLKV